MTVTAFAILQTGAFALGTYDASASFTILTSDFYGAVTDITRKKTTIGTGCTVRLRQISGVVAANIIYSIFYSRAARR